MAQAKILIGMPAFRGADLIGESLQSISDQDHKDFRVVISVDGRDAETAAACEPFLADARFSLVIQQRRLGWAGNINWLMSQPDYDFFCYWQHDDYTSPNYISELLKGSVSHPCAVCYFSGIQWIGDHSEWMGSSCVIGMAANRVLPVFESLNGIPLRGLIRKDAIDHVGPIRITDYESAFEEFVWVGKLAGAGNLQYVEGPVYIKRAREDSVHAKWHGKDRLWRRAVWTEFGLGMLEALWPLVCEADRVATLCTVLDRLCLPKEGRFLFYDGPRVPFASDFVSRALQQFRIPQLESVIAGERSDVFAGNLAGELLDQAIAFQRSRNETTTNRFSFRFRAGDAGIDLLLDGWSSAEQWGTWSVGQQAGLRLPVAAKEGRWKAVLTFCTFGKDENVPVELTIPASSQELTWYVPVRQVVTKELYVVSQSADVVLRFALPNAISPLSLGESADRRRLGIGLVSLDLIGSDGG